MPIPVTLGGSHYCGFCGFCGFCGLSGFAILVAAGAASVLLG